jgi:SAM-dependent MidA family methyltransferase
VSRSRPWTEAWQDALYGPGGFYRAHAPAEHFRTASHAGADVLAPALGRLARVAGCTAVVEVGAGRGELLAALHRADPGLALVGVDLVPRPAGLPAAVRWDAEPPTAPSAPTMLLAWELLDVVPCPVLGAGADGGLHEVHVDDDGREVDGGPASEDDLAWVRRWWPGPHHAGDRVEVGAPRERVWADLVHRVVGRRGLALAVDYDHDLASRPREGSLAGYRAGRAVPPVPDGRHDLTAHVALDAVAAATPPSLVLRQHEALALLGVRAARPDPADAVADPRRYLAALGDASQVHELTDPGGLGGFGWLLHARGDDARRALAGWGR